MKTPKENQLMVEKALALASQGFKVFPLWPLYFPKNSSKLAKQPACWEFFKYSSLDSDTIKHMWSGKFKTTDPKGKGRPMTAPVNSAIAIDTTGLCVIDVDVKDSKAAAKSLSTLPVVRTRRCITLTGGSHLFYSLPAGVEVYGRAPIKDRLTGCELTGLDIRGWHGYVVAAGTVSSAKVMRSPKYDPLKFIHKSYFWKDPNVPISMITPELLAHLPLKTTSIQSDFGTVIEAIDRTPIVISAGSRDDTVFKICCSYRAKSFGREEAEVLLHAVYEKIEQPEGDPFSWQDCLAKLDQAWGYAPGTAANHVSGEQARTNTTDTAQIVVETEWEKPILLEEPQVPKLDDKLLPGILGEITRAVSEATETPLELAAGLVLPVVATACQGKIFVVVKPGYKEPLSFWVVTALDSGSRKSSVLTKVTTPLHEWEKNKRLEIEPLQREALASQKNHEARVKHLRSRYTRANEENREKINADIIELERNPIEIPVIPQLWAQDVTPEHLGTLMNIHNEKMSILSAEGGIFDIIGGRYSNGLSNLDLFLQSHSGDSVRVDRGSRDPVYLDKPALSLGLSPQPDVLRNLGDKQGFRGKGLLARFQYLLPKSNLGYRKLTSEPVPEEIERKYQNVIYKLLDIELAENEFDGSKVPYILKLSKKAYDKWFDFSKEVEKDLREGGRFEHVTDWAGKYPGMTARIAGLLHCAENPDHPWKNKISSETMERSIKFASFLSCHALIAFELIGADKTFVQARKIWRWVERHRHQTFSKRDCFDALKGGFKEVATMEKPLRILIERNYLKEFSKPTGGRPSPGYEVNPEIINGWV